MFIQRKYERTEEDDFKLNVQDSLRANTEAVPVHSPEGLLVGWKIQGRFE